MNDTDEDDDEDVIGACDKAIKDSAPTNTSMKCRKLTHV